jgi:hypothetical protein
MTIMEVPTGSASPRHVPWYRRWYAWAALGALITLAIVLPLVLLSSSSAPVTCRQQYQAWKTGPANPLAKDLAARLNVLDFAGAGAAAARMQAYPIPACADPAHYYTKLLTDVQRVGNTGIIGAMGMMADINADIGNLNRELDRIPNR